MVIINTADAEKKIRKKKDAKDENRTMQASEVNSCHTRTEESQKKQTRIGMAAGILADAGIDHWSRRNHESRGGVRATVDQGLLSLSLILFDLFFFSFFLSLCCWLASGVSVGIIGYIMSVY